MTWPWSHPPTIRQPLLYLRYLLTPYTAAEKACLERNQWFATKGSGYSAEHSTQPQTLGYSIADSPVGLLACVEIEIDRTCQVWQSIRKSPESSR